MAVRVEVSKSHPGLARLMAAAKAMPRLRVEREGVSYERDQLWTREAVAEFFEALAVVAGEDLVLEILEDLRPHKISPRNRLQSLLAQADLEKLVDHPGLSRMLGMLRGI